MNKVLLLQGLPGCGKSTWAKDFINKNPGWVRVNRDDLRIQFGGENYKFNSKIEKQVLNERDKIIIDSLSQGLNVIVDETFCNAKTRKKMEDFLAGKAEVEYKSFMDVSVEECIRRDEGRTGIAKVGPMVIRRMYKQYKADKAEEAQTKTEYKPVDGLPVCILVDMDGTLALIKGRSPYDTGSSYKDKRNEPVAWAVNALKAMSPNLLIFIVTGREDKFHNVTEEWLLKNNVRYDEIYMRPTGDRRPDVEIKHEIYKQNFKGKYNILSVWEDRVRNVKMYRELGLPVFQVAEGDY
jgi:predicted kinase